MFGSPARIVSASPSTPHATRSRSRRLLVTSKLTVALLTHAHNDHIGAVTDACGAKGASAFLHPDD